MHALRMSGLLCLVLIVAGCRMGSSNVAPDRFSYTDAIAQSNNEQLLANLVRLRYNEPPVFLGVGSVLTQYVYGARVAVNGAASQETSAIPGWTIGGAASGSYLERPTITYAPLVGQDFTQQLLAPIDAQAVFALIQSGWSPIELVKLTIERVNDVDGRLHKPVPTERDLEQLREFRLMIELLLVVAQEGGCEMHRDPQTPGIEYLVFNENAEGDTLARIDELKDMLGLARNRWRFRVTDRDIRAPDEITIRARSFGGMLGLESRGIDVPPSHIEDGRAVVMTRPEDDPDIGSLIRLRVRSQEERPDDAFVAIRHQGYWFFIPHSDTRSKETFGLLGYLFQVQAPAASSVGGPVLTVPTG